MRLFLPSQSSPSRFLPFPRLLPCLLCGNDLAPDDSHLLCIDCTLAMPSPSPHICQCCSLPLTVAAPLCGECLQKAPAFARSAIPYSYTYPLDFLILEFKYRHHLASGYCLSGLLLDYVKQGIVSGDITRPELLVPVPLHWWRQWQRGFNQAKFLTDYLRRGLDIPMADACQRKHQPQSQKGLGRNQRQKNLRNIFAMKPGMEKVINNKHIAVVDDVVTTGATARTLSELLIQAGARRVDIWALARTPMTETLESK